MVPSKKPFSIRARLAGFRHAFNGLFHTVRAEHNMWIHMIAAVLVIVSGLLFHITRAEWLMVIFCIGLVLTTEIINSAMERLVDLASPSFSEKARVIKDVAAAAVLIAAITALITGIVIFLPYII
jgi:diacylglycerol kinase